MVKKMKTKYVLVLILLLPFLMAVSPKSTSEIAKPSQLTKSNNSEIHQKPNIHEHGTQDFPIFIKVVHSKNDAEKSQSEANRDKQVIKETARMADYTFWLTIATIILALFTAGLWGITYKLSRDAKKTSDRQANEMKKSLRIAKQSADAATETANIVLSVELPWFVVDMQFIRKGTAIYVNAVLTNQGRTTAIVTKECLVCKICTELPPQPRYPVHTTKPIDFGQIIKSNDSYTINETVDIKKSDNITTEGIPKFLWGYGYIIYVDFLGEAHKFGFGAGASLSLALKTGDTVIFRDEAPRAYTYNRNYKNQCFRVNMSQ